MFGVMFRRLRPRRGAARATLALGAVAALGVGGWLVRDRFVHGATAWATPADQPAPASAPAPSDYTSRVVAYVHQSQPITRQDLGEYLIARYGADKLPTLVNRRIVDQACQNRAVSITTAEVEANLAEELKRMKMDVSTFVKTVLPRYKKNLHEWKEDILRPKLQTARLVQGQVSVTAEEMRKAFESAYGEKVDCRMILWPAAQKKQAMEQYAALRDNEAAFTEAAKKQPNSGLASAGGKIKPIARYAMDENVEKEAFKLMPGQVSTLIETPEGVVMLRCDARVPADTTVSFEKVKGYLEGEIRERKLALEIAAAFQRLKQQARVSLLLKKRDRAAAAKGHPAPGDAVAYIHGNTAITREELGEFLIARYGADKVEFLVNRKIIDAECAARQITVTDEEVEAQLQKDLKVYNVDAKNFEKELLAKVEKNMYEYREDVIRPQLMMRKLCAGRVKVTDDEIKKAFEAHHGEKLDCRVILWPPDQANHAMKEYPKIRDSAEEFDRKARSQAHPNLAAHGGRLPPIGRHTLGDEALEREAFRLQPGDVSILVGTAQGQVVVKCDKRIPPDKGVKLEQVRDQLRADVMERKVQMEMQVAFKELKEKAKPQMILKPTSAAEDLAATTKELMSGLPPAPPK